MAKKKWKRKRRMVKHHIINRCNGGKKTKENLLLMDEEREKAFHFLFGNLTLEGASKLLMRVSKMKRRQK